MANNSTCISESAVVPPARLSDRDLLDAIERVAGDERRTTAELLALLAELDSRKLYLGEGYSSLFTYCTQRLLLSESAAYGRITAARAARRFPILLSRLVEGDITLTSISLLAAHLTEDNHEALLDSARHASRRDIERLIASLHAQPDIPTSVRRIPQAGEQPGDAALVFDDTREVRIALPSGSGTRGSAASTSPPMPQPPVRPLATPTRTSSRPTVAPLAADRYLLRLTIDASTHSKLERARDLMRHIIPNGDPALIVDRALTVLVEQLERRKSGRVSRPARTHAIAKPARGRHIPAAVRRAVWTRDQGRCAFVGPHGRCTETGFLEYHHAVPFAAGGVTDASNLELRCRAHNTHEATVWFGGEERPPSLTSTAGSIPRLRKC